MQLRWSPDAADDLERIASHIRKDSPEAAQRIAREIYDGVGQLRTYPSMGRPGRVRGTRELVLPSLPFVAVYRLTAEAVEIVRILHGRQRWP